MVDDPKKRFSPSLGDGKAEAFWDSKSQLGVTLELPTANDTQQQAQDVTGETPLSNGEIDSLRGALDAIQRAVAAGIQVGQDVVGQIEDALRTGKAAPTLNLATAASRGQEAEALTVQKTLTEGLGTTLAMAGSVAATFVVPGAQVYSHLSGAVKEASAGFIALFDRNADGTARNYLASEDTKKDKSQEQNPYLTTASGNTGQFMATTDTFQTTRNQTVLSQMPAITLGQGQGIARNN